MTTRGLPPLFGFPWEQNVPREPSPRVVLELLEKLDDDLEEVEVRLFRSGRTLDSLIEISPPDVRRTLERIKQYVNEALSSSNSALKAEKNIVDIEG